MFILVLFIAKFKECPLKSDDVQNSLPLKLLPGPSSSSKVSKLLGSSHRITSQPFNLGNVENTTNTTSDILEGIASDITLSRTPPWQKNSLLAQPLPVVNQSSEVVETSSQLGNVRQQPPWHDGNKRRNLIKREPNFKEDPTGYLNHQTAILHNSILNLHSPEIRDETVTDRPMNECNVEKDEQLGSASCSTKLNHFGDTAIQNTTSSVHSKQENRSKTNVLQYSKPHIAIGPNGQPVRIIQNAHQFMYAGDSNEFSAQPQVKSCQSPSGIYHKDNNSIVIPGAKQTSMISEQTEEANRCLEIRLPSKVINETLREQSNKVTAHKSMQDSLSFPSRGQQFFEIEKRKCDTVGQSHLTVKRATTHPPKIIKYMGNIRRRQESPVSSSTHNEVLALDEILPPHIASNSTSNDTIMVTSPTISEIHVAKSETSAYSTKYHNIYMAAQTSGRNTITSVLAGKAMTSTTSAAQNHVTNEKIRTSRPNISENTIHVPSNRKFIKANHNQIIQISKTHNLSANNSVPRNDSITVPTSHNISNGIQNFAQLCAEGSTSQIIMTSTGQILMMPPALHDKTHSQMIIGGSTNNALMVNNNLPASNLVINAQNAHHTIRNELVQSINENGTTNMMANSNSLGMVIQNRNNVTGGNTNILQSTNNSNNYILGTSSNMQPMILNNSNMISHSGNVLSPTGATLIPSVNSSNIIASANPNKTLSNASNLLASTNIINQQHVIGHNNPILSGNTTSSLLSPSGGIVGQQTVLLNQLSNGSYVIQPQTIIDGQVMSVIGSDGTNQFMQQRLMVSPDAKRRTIKRKNSSLSPSTQNANESPMPSPTVQQSSTSTQQMLQITPHYQPQSFQISPGGAGIALVQNKPSPINTTSQQQVLLQNGSTILQPINLIGQQLILPTGLMMAPDATTLLQIQNVAST